MCSAILPEGRFADAQEYRFQAVKLSNIDNAVLLGGQLPTS